MYRSSWSLLLNGVVEVQSLPSMRGMELEKAGSNFLVSPKLYLNLTFARE